MSNDYDNLTEKQKRFIDFYIEKGNATEAARLAGYKGNNLNTVAAQNLAKLSIFIEERMEQLETKRIASATEVLEYFTTIMRDKKEDTNDRTKCAELLGKRHGLFKESIEINSDKPFEVNINIRKNE